MLSVRPRVDGGFHVKKTALLLVLVVLAALGYAISQKRKAKLDVELEIEPRESEVAAPEAAD